ncbi:MAG: FG-GAP-like repeat-containing protein [Raineya sp.]|jgi:hypothetical protein|nr:FG-GAP-like repeat-containing protein [Raineya sp.]
MTYKLLIFLLILFLPKYTSHSDRQLHHEINTQNVSFNVPLKKYMSTYHDDTTKNGNWYKKVTSDIEASLYHIHEDIHNLTYHSVNVQHGFRTKYNASGFSIQNRINQDDYISLNIKGVLLDKIPKLSTENICSSYIKGDSLKIQYEGWFTEYINDSNGIRQNFIIEENLGLGELKLQLSVNSATTIVKKSSNEINLNTDNQTVIYKDLKVWDAEGKLLNADFRVEEQNINIVVNASNAVYPVTIDPLSTTHSWISDGNQNSALLGTSVASAGDINGDGFSDVIVGAPNFDNGETDEGRVYVYHGSATGLSTTPNWTAEVNQAGAEFGFSVSTAGDVNGDGFSDVIVGANKFDAGETDEGRAYVYHGSATGLSTTPNWTTESNQVDALLGWSVSTAGDVNGDGFSDVIVGAIIFDNGETDEGRAYIHHGSATGLSITPNWVAESNQIVGNFGWSVASAGDVNGDGFSDVIVGVPFFTNGQTYEGGAHVYHGSTIGLSITPNWTAESNQIWAQFGISVSSAGDVNGDGFSDVVVGANRFDNGEVDEGRAYVYHGSAAGLSTTSSWQVESNQANAEMGIYVSNVGDVNGDGFSDVAIGAWWFDNGEVDEGRVYVYHGSITGLSTTPNWQVESNQANANLGVSIASAGDVNGDGFSDVIVGAWGFDAGETDEGRVWLYLGSPNTLSSVVNWMIESNQTNAFLGISVSSAGDVNGDGFSDVIVGAYGFDAGQTNEGRAYVYHGSAAGLSTTPNWTAESNQANAFFGISVSSAGDVNGDGFSDVIVGAHFYDNGQIDEGQVYVYHGSATGLSTTPNWTRDSNQAGAQFGYCVSTAGDVNGDGFSDVLIGAYRYDAGEADEGITALYYGSATGLSTFADWIVEGNQAGAFFGFCVATAGDVNGDGFSDVAIGAYSFDAGEANEGRGFVYYGSSIGLSIIPNWTAESNVVNAFFSNSIATAGDVNGDGFSDVAVGAWDLTNGETNEGRVYVYHGSIAGLSTTPSWQVESNQANANFGQSVASAGDVNGDGYSDLIMGASGYSNGQTEEGGAFLYHGSATGLSVTPNWQIESNQAFSLFGYSVSSAGDVNGDGYSDIIIGAYEFDAGQTNEGQVYMHYGNNQDNMRSNLKLYNDDLTSLINQSNVNSTSFGVGLFGQSFLGRVKGKVVWEVRPQGQPFSSNPITNSVQFSDKQGIFSDLGISGTEIKNIVLKVGRQNKVRARIEYDKTTAITGQVYSPWRYTPDYLRGHIAHDNTPLPLKLLSFTVQDKGCQASLTWITSQEFDIEQYILEQSSNGLNFQEVVSVNPHNKNSQNVYNQEVSQTNQINYYRLKIIDKNHIKSYSKVISLQPLCFKTKLSIYPNPVVNSIVNVESLGLAISEAHIFSISGDLRKIYKVKGEKVQLNLQDMSQGIYLLKLYDEQNNFIEVHKILLLN